MQLVEELGYTFNHLYFIHVNINRNTQARRMICNQSETSTSVSCWLQLTGFAVIAYEFDKCIRIT